MLPGVVVAVKNEAGYLIKNIPCWLRHFDEIVVVDNGSTDQTTAIVTNFPIRYIRFEQPLKRSQCWNEGAKAIQSEHVLFLHGDVTVPGSAVDALSSLWENQSIDYSCFRIHFPENSFNFRWLEMISNFRSRYLKLIYGDQGMCIRKSVFEQIGGFPEEFLLEDLKINKKLRHYHAGFVEAPIFPSSRKFHKLGFFNYLWLMNKILFLNALGTDTQKIYQLYYNPNLNNALERNHE
ncbi:MAG: glycosyltransferase [SAR324 cluster bacterium]|nr:glycosyltransferase [SAR324 cluster bacterium]